MSLHRSILLVALSAVVGLPSTGSAQNPVTYDVAYDDDSSPGMSSDAFRSMLQQALDVSEMNLPDGVFGRVVQLFEQQPDAEIIVFDHRSNQLLPANRRGQASFTVGSGTTPPRGCGRSCADWKNPRRLTLDNANTTVTAPGLGDVSVRILRNANAAGALDPNSGRAYVELPVLIRIPRSELFERGLNTQAVFRGFGQMTAQGFLVVDVARLQTPDGRILDVIARHTVNLGDKIER